MFKYPWQKTVIDAAREYDPLDLLAKVEKAEATVRARMTALLEDGNDPEERMALVEAFNVLRKLGGNLD
jgi:hypothetical protein